MKRSLHVVIDAGEKTCASKAGEFCKELHVRRMGTEWVCGLFGSKRVTDENGADDGWLQRLPECLAAEASK